MKITAIKQQVKKADRYSIYVDEEYAFSLSERALIESGIASKQELTRQQLNDFKQLSADDKQFQRAIRYVALRSRSEWELAQYLMRHDSPAPLIEQITNRLRDLGLVDDGKYALAFIHDRQLLRPTSRRKIKLELQKKHVKEVHISAALEASGSADSTALSDVIAHKRRQSKYQDDTKLMQYLARQGFNYSDIQSALHVESDGYD